MEICVLTEFPIECSNILMEVRIVGGLLLEDDGKADDKIIAVHKDEGIWSKIRDVKELPVKVIE